MGYHKPLPGNLCELTTGRFNDVTRRIYEALGIRGTTIPKTMCGNYMVDGHRVHVRPGRSGGPRSHRIFVDVGGRLVPSGRVRQVLKFLCGMYPARRRGRGGKFTR